MRGRKPKPTATKRLQGNPGKRKPNPKEAKPPAEIPDCPGHLVDAARVEWERVVGLLHANGLLTQFDRAALAAYCAAWGRWVEAEDKLREHGPIVKSATGTAIQNPYLSVANKALKQLKEFMVEFGMTPSSRSRVNTKPPETSDPMDDFLGS